MVYTKDVGKRQQVRGTLRRNKHEVLFQNPPSSVASAHKSYPI